MFIKTKKITFTPQDYLKIGLRQRITNDWWTYLIFGLMAGLSIYFRKPWIGILGFFALALYFGFFALQFFGIRFLENSNIMFMPTMYEFSPDGFTGIISTNQGYKLDWLQIKKLIPFKKYDLLVLSLGHFIYLPHSSFASESQRDIMRSFFKKSKDRREKKNSK